MIKAIAFDMDGVIFDTERYAVESWVAVGREWKKPLTWELGCSVVGLDASQAITRFQQALGQDFDFWRARERRTELMRQRMRENGMPIRPGVRELLQFLKDQNYRVCLATSTAAEIVDWYFEHCDLGPYFETRITGDMVPKRKPDPAIYQLACQALQMPPEQVAAVEDSNAGIAAAYRAGCRPVMIPDLVQPTKEIETVLWRRLASADELIAILRQEAEEL